ADQIVANYGLETLVVKLASRRHELAAGIVDEDVQPAEFVLDAQHGAVDLVGQANVGGDRDGLAAEFADNVGAVLDRFGASAQHHDVGAAARHLDRRGT